MTFPRRGTRRLVVDGRLLLWHVSPKREEYGGYATIGFESSAGVLHYRPGAGFPSPREAESVARFALAQGWDRNAAGTRWMVDLDGEWVLKASPPGALNE